MVRKVVAGVLVALILVPFTAPFSTFDMTDVAGTGQTAGETAFVPFTSPNPHDDAAVGLERPDFRRYLEFFALAVVIESDVTIALGRVLASIASTATPPLALAPRTGILRI